MARLWFAVTVVGKVLLWDVIASGLYLAVLALAAPIMLTVGVTRV